MPIKHIEVLRNGEEEEFKVVETSQLPAWDKNAEFTIVGRPHARLEGVEKVTGRARYSYDVRLSGQLYACVLRSPHPHARIRHMDIAAAAALPGVHAVLCAENAPDIKWYEEESQLFDRTLRFVGDEVAAVAAESEEIARDALRLIKVEYELLPFVLDMAAAIEPNAPQIHAKGNRVAEPTVYERGDIEAGLQMADIVIDQTYTTQTALHNCLEPHGCTATWEGDHLTLWESTQGIFEVREQVAEKLGLPEHHVRVIKQHMGGGFGSKQIAW